MRNIIKWFMIWLRNEDLGFVWFMCSIVYLFTFKILGPYSLWVLVSVTMIFSFIIPKVNKEEKFICCFIFFIIFLFLLYCSVFIFY